MGKFPESAYYMGSSSIASVRIQTVTGTSADGLAADKAMRAKLGDPSWKRPRNYVWNHAGRRGSKVMELVDKATHGALAHRGPAAVPRAARAFAVLSVYLELRDALRAAGVLQPEFVIEQQADYFFTTTDGDVFVVLAPGWVQSGRLEFVAGPRKGETIQLTNEQVDVYRKAAEGKWGKYIPGTIFRGPRFIPGTERSSLPLYGKDGLIGWIDEDGVHYYLFHELLGKRLQ